MIDIPNLIDGAVVIDLKGRHVTKIQGVTYG